MSDRESIKARLDELKISYDGRWGDDKLEALLKTAEETLESGVPGIPEPSSEPVAAEPEMGVEAPEPESVLPADVPVEEAAKLAEPPKYTDEQMQNIADEVSGRNRLTTDELTEAVGLRKELGGETKTRSGIVIPASALAALEKTPYVWIKKDESNSCTVYKVNRSNRETFVREYSLDRHGEHFKEMAEQFVEKRNRLGR